MSWHRRHMQSSRSTDESILPDIQIDPDMVVEDVRILIDEQLGHGGYGVVYVGDWRGTPVAVKRVHSTLVDDQVATEHRNAFLENFAREWRLFGNLRHPFIVQFLGVYQPKSLTPALVMELMEETLQKRYKRSPYLREDMTVRLCGEVLCALVYLHGRGIVHRDLTTNNVLLTRGSDPTAKISDLGVARALFGDDPRRRVQLTQSRGMTRGPGSILYMSPESVDDSGRPYDTKHDVFSFGVLALSTSVRHEPTCMEQPRRVPLGDGSGNTHVVPEVERRAADLENLPPAHPLRGVILQCLRDSPSERPTASELLTEFERLPATASLESATAADYDTESLRDELARVHQELQAVIKCSADRERVAQEQIQQLQKQLTTALEAERGSADRERAELQEQNRQLQQQLLTVERQLTAANEQACAADQRARIAVEQCKLSRRVSEEVRLSERNQLVTTTTSSTASTRQGANAAVAPAVAHVTVRLLSSFRWKWLADIPGDGKCWHHTLHFGEWIVLIGGLDKHRDACSRVYAYHVGDGQWTEWPETPHPICSAATDGQYLYVMGGECQDRTPVRSAYRLNDDFERWIKMTDLPHAVRSSASTFHKGKLFVHGGDKSDFGRLQAFDFSQRSWSVLPSAPYSARSEWEKSALIAWGDYLVSHELRHYFDILSNEWCPLPRRQAGRSTALVVINNKLIAVSSSRKDSSDDQLAVDVLESVHSNWFSLPRLPSPRYHASACAFGSIVFVAGGVHSENSFLCFA